MDEPHAEVEIKPQLKPRGSVARAEDPNLPTSCTSCRLNALCVYGVYKRSLRTPTKEKTLVQIAVELEVRTHRSRTRLESELPPQQVQRQAQCWRAS